MQRTHAIPGEQSRADFTVTDDAFRVAMSIHLHQLKG